MLWVKYCVGKWKFADCLTLLVTEGFQSFRNKRAQKLCDERGEQVCMTTNLTEHLYL